MIKKNIVALFVLGISFVGVTNALDLSYNGDFGTGEIIYTYMRGSNEIKISQEGNFTTNGIYNGLQFRPDEGQGIFFRNSGDLKAIVQKKIANNLGRCYNNTPRIQPTTCGEYDQTIQDMVQLNNGIAFNGFGIESPGFTNIAYRSTYSNAYICFYNNHSYCAKLQTPENAEETTDSNACSNDGWQGCGISNYTNILIEYSPFNLGGNGGGNNNGGITNREVYDAYGEAGYYKGLCYSDFSINSLATLSGGLQQFYEIEREDGEYYTGAKITDLRSYYGSGQDFSSWFNYWYVQYKNSLALSNTNVNPAVNYVGMSKGLWYMIYKYYGAGLGNSSVNYTKLFNFCVYFQDFDLTDGTADLDYSGPDLPDEVSILVQNNFQYGTGVLGHFTGDDLSFDAESFFNELTTKLNNLLSSPNQFYIGVIPSYILMVLMALIFIRLISH